MKTIFSIATIFCFLAMMPFSSCYKKPVDDPNDINEEELITTLKIMLKDNAGNDYSTIIFSDPDGLGGAGPARLDTIKLKASQTYTASLILLDESKSPAEDITEEIAAESKDHQFFFHPDGATLTISYADEDENGLPVGLKTNWTTAAASTGSLKVVLKHQPDNKHNDEAHGETDIEVSFPLVIQ